jgi:hypothetical protein
MRTAISRFASKAIVPLLFLVVVSCSNRGPKTGRVEGKVTFEGNPVNDGAVSFLNLTDGASAGANLKPDGTFVCDGPVVVGDYVVVITPHMHIVDTDPGKSPPAPVEKPAPNIPPKYRQQGTTPLKAKVEEGKNSIDLKMTKGP